MKLSRSFFSHAARAAAVAAVSGATFTVRADPASELAAFSVFPTVDVAQLAKSEVKTAHGAPMNSPRFISVQSLYVSPRPPAQEMAAMRNWTPTAHSESKIYLHSEINGAPGGATFARLRSAPDNGPVRALVQATQKMSNDLQVSNEEAKKFSPASAVAGGGAMPAAVANFWSDVLAGRAQAFLGGGLARQPSYDHSGQPIRPAEEFIGLLRQQEKIRKQFSGLTDNISSGTGRPEMYWELLNVEDQGVLTLGASSNRAGANGTYQAADTLYYASGGYYLSLTLFQLWPVTVDGKPATLVWRGDMISSSALTSLHGIERIASESSMMRDIGRSITFFRRDTAGNR